MLRSWEPVEIFLLFAPGYGVVDVFAPTLRGRFSYVG